MLGALMYWSFEYNLKNEIWMRKRGTGEVEIAGEAGKEMKAHIIFDWMLMGDTGHVHVHVLFHRMHTHRSSLANVTNIVHVPSLSI